MKSQIEDAEKSSVLKLLSIYLLTNAGSSLTTVVAFLSVEGSLSSLQSVSNALAIRTLGFVVFSYFTPAILNHFGEKKSLLIAELFGLIALFILGLGFQSHDAFLIYLGVALTGLPGNLTSTGMIASLRNLISDPDQFRFYSSRRDLIGGVTLCFAGFFVPLLLLRFSITSLLLFDATTYVAALILLFLIKLSAHEKAIDAKIFPDLKTFGKPDVGKFFLVVSGSLALMACLPLIASSELIRESIGLNADWFKAMWGIEGLVSIVASYLYPKLRSKKFAMSIFFLNALPLVFLPLINFVPLQLLLLAIIPIGFDIVFLEARDTLILSAKDNKYLMNHYIAISSLGRSLWGTVSPYLLTGLFKSLGIILSGAILSTIQFLELFFRRKKLGESKKV